MYGFAQQLRVIGLMSRMFANGPGDHGSIPGWVIPKSQKLVLGAALLYTQHYKVQSKGKVEQSRERSSALPLHFGVVAIEKGAFESHSTRGSPTLLYGLNITKSTIKQVEASLNVEIPFSKTDCITLVIHTKHI